VRKALKGGIHEACITPVIAINYGQRKKNPKTHIFARPKVPGSQDLALRPFDDVEPKLEDGLMAVFMKLEYNSSLCLKDEEDDKVFPKRLKKPSSELNKGCGAPRHIEIGWCFWLAGGVSIIQPSVCLNSTTKASSDAMYASSRVLSLSSITFPLSRINLELGYSTALKLSVGKSSLQTR
jgi:hypothetical protein